MENNKENVIQQTRYIGLDISKKNIHMTILNDTVANKIIRHVLKTDANGLAGLVNLLNIKDIVVLETGNQSFRIAAYLKANGLEQVYVLNAGELHIIFKSLKKTDKEDSLKLARLAMRHPIDELPVVPIPSEEEMENRRLVSEQCFWSENKTSLINRLHSVFISSGITGLKKSDLKNVKYRTENINKLPEKFRSEANRLLNGILESEKSLAIVEDQINHKLKKHISLTTLYMSLPGIGPISTFVLISYLYDMLRFANSSQIVFYSGLVPKIESSGEMIHYKSIGKNGSSFIRRVMIQAAWSHVSSNKNSEITKFYNRLAHRIGKGKAIVAVARKMLVILFSMIRNGEFYRSYCEKKLRTKLLHYRIITAKEKSISKE